MTTNTIEKVKNYQGNNSFVNKMKDVLKKYQGLTPRQIEAVEKCLNSEVKVLDVNNLPEDIKTIIEYSGENTFVQDIIRKFKQYGTLTEKQKSAALKQIQAEIEKEKTMRMNWPVTGESILIGRKVGIQLKEQYGLKFNPRILDITKLLAVSPKAVKFAGKMTVKRAKVCIHCCKTLTDEFSMLTNMGKICAKHLGIEYITDKSQAEKFREEYLKKVEEIGEMEFWVPKSQIKKWEGHLEIVVDSIKL